MSSMDSTWTCKGRSQLEKKRFVTRWAPTTSYKKGPITPTYYRGYNPTHLFIRPFVGAVNPPFVFLVFVHLVGNATNGRQKKDGTFHGVGDVRKYLLVGG